MPQATDNTGAIAPYYAQEPRAAIRNFVLYEMLRGAGYAALFVVSVGVFLWVVYLFGQLLPAESKNAPPPMPYSAVKTIALTAQV